MVHPVLQCKGYGISFDRKSLKFLKKASLTQRTLFIEKLDELVAGFPVDIKKLKAKTPLYRIRVGDYRIIFEPDHTKKIVFVHGIAHRKDAYKPTLLLKKKTSFH